MKRILDKIRYQRLKTRHGVHFGDDDIIINEMRLNSVYEYPMQSWEYEDVADFYVDTKKELFFLKVIKSKQPSKTVRKNKEIDYYIVETELDINDIKNLEEIVRQLRGL